jgi:hypothetical protein
MQITLRSIRSTVAVAVTALLLAAAQTNVAVFAQTPATSAALSEVTIKSLQEALNKQGIATNSDGVLNDQTRASIRKYQSQHHLPVTGEPDKATLDKLGVNARQTAVPSGQADQAAAPGSQMMAGGMMAGRMMQGGMMSCPMMQGQAAAPSGMMRGGMQMQPGQIPQGGVSDREMMQSMMQMMLMMQGMMQMMHAQLQRQQAPTAPVAPMQPGSMPQDQIQPGQMQHGPR